MEFNFKETNLWKFAVGLKKSSQVFTFKFHHQNISLSGSISQFFDRFWWVDFSSASCICRIFGRRHASHFLRKRLGLPPHFFLLACWRVMGHLHLQGGTPDRVAHLFSAIFRGLLYRWPTLVHSWHIKKTTSVLIPFWGNYCLGMFKTGPVNRDVW